LIYKYFYNANEQRLTAGVRIVIQFALFFSAYILTIVVTSGIDNYYVSNLTQELLLIPFGIISIYLPIYFFDKRKFSHIGFQFSRKWVFDFFYGISIGGILMLFVFLLLLTFNKIEITSIIHSDYNYYFPIEISGRFLGYLSIGFIEEAFSRGYHIKNISEGLNKKNNGEKSSVIFAWIISSVIFGILHGANPDVSILGIINLFLIGFLYGYAYVVSGSLAFPIGLHTAWNFFQGNVFGFNVSGFKPEVTFILTKNIDNDLISGGNFGPEAGLIMLPTILIGFILSYFFLKFRCNSASINPLLSVYKK
jgi:membrane protease YdiL (CAAX protease family)